MTTIAYDCRRRAKLGASHLTGHTLRMYTIGGAGGILSPSHFFLGKDASRDQHCLLCLWWVYVLVIKHASVSLAPEPRNRSRSPMTTVLLRYSQRLCISSDGKQPPDQDNSTSNIHNLLLFKYLWNEDVYLKNSGFQLLI